MDYLTSSVTGYARRGDTTNFQVAGGKSEFDMVAISRLNLSARAYDPFLKLACAITDLAEGEETNPHIRQRCSKSIIEAFLKLN